MPLRLSSIAEAAPAWSSRARRSKAFRARRRRGLTATGAASRTDRLTRPSSLDVAAVAETAAAVRIPRAVHPQRQTPARSRRAVAGNVHLAERFSSIGRTDRCPSWLCFHLALIAVLSRYPPARPLSIDAVESAEPKSRPWPRSLRSGAVDRSLGGSHHQPRSPVAVRCITKLDSRSSCRIARRFAGLRIGVDEGACRMEPANCFYKAGAANLPVGVPTRRFPRPRRGAISPTSRGSRRRY